MFHDCVNVLYGRTEFVIDCRGCFLVRQQTLFFRQVGIVVTGVLGHLVNNVCISDIHRAVTINVIANGQFHASTGDRFQQLVCIFGQNQRAIGSALIFTAIGLFQILSADQNVEHSAVAAVDQIIGIDSVVHCSAVKLIYGTSTQSILHTQQELIVASIFVLFNKQVCSLLPGCGQRDIAEVSGNNRASINLSSCSTPALFGCISSVADNPLIETVHRIVILCDGKVSIPLMLYSMVF